MIDIIWENRERLPNDIRELKELRIPLFVYGNSCRAEKIIEKLRSFQIEIRGVIVSEEYYSDDNVFGLKCYSINEFKDEKISVFLGFNECIHRDLIKKLANAEYIEKIYILEGCEAWWHNNYNFLDDDKIQYLDSYYPGVIRRKLDYNYYSSHKELFEQTYSWLSDEKSKETMRSYLDGHINISPFPLRNVWTRDAVDDQYFDKTIVNLSDHEVFLDCGAYTGDTYDSFVNHVHDYEKYYAFEPDERLLDVLKKKLKYDKKMVLIDKAVYDCSCIVPFSIEEACGIVKENDKKRGVQAISIDDVVKEDITFIKMDLEGCEFKALHGAERSIKKSKPILAICVYHKREDLITIPQYIKQLNSEYRLYLRAHFPYVSETVLYAIPQGR